MANGTAGSSDGANRIDDAPYAVAEPSHAGEPIDEPAALPSGSRLGGYRILRLLGRGGMGTVYSAENLGTAHGGGDDPTEVAISVDGSDWLTVGRHRGGTSGMDISKVAKPGQRYAYVRLVDAGEASAGGAVGADIDAVQLLNCVPVSAFASASKPLARVAPWFEMEADKPAPGPPAR